MGSIYLNDVVHKKYDERIALICDLNATVSKNLIGKFGDNLEANAKW